MAAIPDPRPAAARRRRQGAQGDAGRDPRLRGARHRAGAARQPAPGRRAARRARRLLRHARARRRPRDAEARAARRRPRPRRAAARARREAGEVRRREAAQGGRASSSSCSRTSTPGKTMADWPGELPPELEPLTTKPLIAIENGPDGIDLKLEAELAELPDEEAAEFRGSGESALGEVVRRLARHARPDHVLHRRREGHARLDAAQGPDGDRGGGHDPLRHRARLHPLRGDPLGRPRRGRLARGGLARGQAAPRGQDVRRRGRRRAEHPLQRLGQSLEVPPRPRRSTEAPQQGVSDARVPTYVDRASAPPHERQRFEEEARWHSCSSSSRERAP